MKQFFKMFFASLLAMVVCGVIIVGLIFGSVASLMSKKDKTTTFKTNSVLVVDLQKHIHELGESNPLALFSNELSSTAGLYDIVTAIAKAKKDNSIKGILIKLQPGSNGWGTLQQIRMAINDFKTSGKFVYAYGENISQGDYFVGSVADSVYLNPVGNIELKGFSSVMPFFKNTLDRLELQPEIFYAGKFKSATEPFRYDKMSEPNKLQVSQFQQSFWKEYVKAVAEHTHADANTINEWTNTGAVQFPGDALKYKLVDGLLYWDEVESRMRSKTGTKANANISYIAVSEYANTPLLDLKNDNARIAILFAEGEISDGEQSDDYQIASRSFVANIRKLAKNDNIKAVVLRINSPGGSALASEVILRELQLLRKKKPLVVSMGDVAASGGYYIACQADSIFALPNTITGSIGVFSMLFNIQGLMKNKLGVTFDGVKTAPYADFPTVARTLTADEQQRMQHSVDTIYSIFKSRVATGRRISEADVDSIAQGRVWSGTDALNIHLIDGIGGLGRAIHSAATLAKLTNYKVSTYPERIDKWQSMMRRFKTNDVSEEMMKATLKQELGADYEWIKKIQNLRKMQGKALMMLPMGMSIN
ncbi:MAG: signal peptide peptidase SppA [Taibaiella sp.]|nr:signal peptide peptidase SppA [Taibaiella sp.]